MRYGLAAWARCPRLRHRQEAASDLPAGERYVPAPCNASRQRHRAGL